MTPHSVSAVYADIPVTAGKSTQLSHGIRTPESMALGTYRKVMSCDSPAGWGAGLSRIELPVWWLTWDMASTERDMRPYAKGIEGSILCRGGQWHHGRRGLGEDRPCHVAVNLADGLKNG